MMEDVPNFLFSEEEIAKIKASVGATDVDESQPSPLGEERPVAKRRGRPPGSKNKTTLDFGPSSSEATLNLAPAPLTKREEREVASRLGNILMGATGMAGVVKPYLPMTEEEAKAIAEPLASYLIRNEPTNGIAREILENYDLLAMTLGVGAYSVRVYHDRHEEVESRKPANTTATQRVSDLQVSPNGRQPNEGTGTLVSIPNASRSGSTPFDL
jgi:hypothetical protein